MVSRLELEEQKKHTKLDANEEGPQVIMPLFDKNKEDSKDTVFCKTCGSYHIPTARLRCALKRAFRKIEVSDIYL